MSVHVRIPTILRTYTGGASEVTAEGDTLAAVLDDLEAPTPGSGRGSSTRPASCAGSSTSTSATTTCASSTGWRPRPRTARKISVIPAVAGG